MIVTELMESTMSVDVALDNIRIRELPTINLSGGVDFDLDEIRIKELAPINVGITEIPPINIGVTQLPDFNLNANLSVDSLPTIRLETQSILNTDSKLKTDSSLTTDNKVDLALDVRFQELPQLDLQLGLRPMRFHFPLSYRFNLSVFGINIFEFSTCGEGMIVAEDYRAKAAERCE
ncbi:MAG: hypothetical protein ACI8Z9_002672 [Paraglaciecola sp.]|jgi:hypothetical protein